MKKILTSAVLVSLCLLAGCGADSGTATTDSTTDTASAEYAIASLKGPTTLGMLKLMDDSDNGLTSNKYNVTVYGAADEIVAGVVSGSTDIANVPANLASVLYAKTEGKIRITDVNTLGVLYVVTNGEDISSVADLKGKTVCSTGQGTTPEYVFNHILRANGLEPGTDVTVEFRSEASEAAAVIAEKGGIAVLPQPYVTAAQAKNDSIVSALSLTDEWDKVCETPLITGVTIAQEGVISENEAAFGVFLDEYCASVDFVNSDTDAAAALSGKYDIIAEGVAKKAIPQCNITFLTGDDMRRAVKGYLDVLASQDPRSVGGAVPDDSAFFG